MENIVERKHSRCKVNDNTRDVVKDLCHFCHSKHSASFSNEKILYLAKINKSYVIWWIVKVEFCKFSIKRPLVNKHNQDNMFWKLSEVLALCLFWFSTPQV